MPDSGIERGEHARVGQHVGAGQPVEQRRFSRVGVSHQRDGRQRNRLPLAALRAAPAAHAFQLIVQLLDAAIDARGGRFRVAFRRDLACRCRRPSRDISVPRPVSRGSR